jgi:hypothetical protein
MAFSMRRRYLTWQGNQKGAVKLSFDIFTAGWCLGGAWVDGVTIEVHFNETHGCAGVYFVFV